MASFNVGRRFGLFMAKQGFRVEENKLEKIPFFGPNKELLFHNSQRPMRLFAPSALKGKTAKKWFNKVFWICYKYSREQDRVLPVIPYG